MTGEAEPISEPAATTRGSTVTAIIPTYNRRELVMQSARSVLAPELYRCRVPGNRQRVVRRNGGSARALGDERLVCASA